MTDTIEQAEDLLESGDEPDSFEEITDIIRKLVDELKEIKANNIQIWDDARELQAALTESNRQRDVMREALTRLASMETFTVSRAITKHDDELIARIGFAQQALKETSPPEGATHEM